MTSDSIPLLDTNYANELCGICFESQDFRTLQCGHCCCIECLTELRDSRGSPIHCPWCWAPDHTEITNLPRPHQFNGRVFPSFYDDGCRNFPDLLSEQIRIRKRTIDQLRFVASTLHSVELMCADVKVGGSAVGLMGGAMAILGWGLTFTGFGALLGVTLGTVGTAFAGTGGMATTIGIIVESVLKKNRIDEIERDLQEDRFRSEQITILLRRAAQDRNFARRWNIDQKDAASIVSAISQTIKACHAARGVRTAVSVGTALTRASAKTGLRMASVVFHAVFIPIDLVQMIHSSIKIHKKEPSELVKMLKDTADNLEKDLENNNDVRQ